MEYKLETLATWLNTFKAGDVEMDEKISHWVHGLMDDEVTQLILLLNKRGLHNYITYFYK